ncbi:MAG: ABC transporter substrate-binding protein [Actinomycetota bacterium]
MTSPSRPSSWLVVAVLLTALLPACTGEGTGDPTPVRIAFFQDLSVPEHVDLVSPSFLALDMVLTSRTEGSGVLVEVVQLDTAGDEVTAVDMADEVAADPSFVLAVVAPFWREPVAVARILAEAGVPTVSLSPVSPSPWTWAPSDRPPGDPGELWRRLVPDQEAQARLLADIAARTSSGGERESVCLVDDESAYGTALLQAVDEHMQGWPSTMMPAADAPEAVASSGCRVVVWGGFPTGAAELVRSLRDAGVAGGRPVDLAGDAMKTVIPPTSPTGDGIVVGSVSCPCVDVTLDLSLASRRFVNAYQSEHGLAPGVYAAEGWDAGRLAAEAILEGATDRADMRAAVAADPTFEGIAGRYAFDAAGELDRQVARLFAASGTRWLPQPV